MRLNKIAHSTRDTCNAIVQFHSLKYNEYDCGAQNRTVNDFLAALK